MCKKPAVFECGFWDDGRNAACVACVGRQSRLQRTPEAAV
jgi:hypothetical protein